METCLSCMLSSSSSVTQVGDVRELHLSKLTKLNQLGNGRNLNDCRNELRYSWPKLSSQHCDWKYSSLPTSNDMSTKLGNISANRYIPKEMMVTSQVNSETADRSMLLLPKPLSMTQLLNNTLQQESRFRVAYQGAPGAYAEAAAVKAFPHCELVAYNHFETVFQAVDRSIVDYAIVPIENSLCGNTYKTFDLILQHGLHIIGEVQLPVHHCLLAAAGVRKEQVKRVISHPQALEQCQGTLAKLGVACKAVEGTADAAKLIAQNGLQETAAIASERAAELYGLDILATGVEDNVDNVTRFVMLARDPIVPKTNRPFKTCIVFTLEDGPGMLFKALSAFYIRGIKLKRIESRPQKKRPLHIVDHQKNGVAKYFEYLFYIDFEASMADPGAQNALQQLQEFAPFLRVLGSYPVDASDINAN